MKKELKFSGLLLVILSIISFISFYYLTYINNYGFYFWRYSEVNFMSKFYFLLRVFIPILLIPVFVTLYRLLSKKNGFIASVGFYFGMLSSVFLIFMNLRFLYFYRFISKNYNFYGDRLSDFSFQIFNSYLGGLVLIVSFLLSFWFILCGIAIIKRSRISTITGFLMLFYGVFIILNIWLNLYVLNAFLESFVFLILGFNLLFYRPARVKVIYQYKDS